MVHLYITVLRIGLHSSQFVDCELSACSIKRQSLSGALNSSLCLPRLLPKVWQETRVGPTSHGAIIVDAVSGPHQTAFFSTRLQKP